MKNILYSVLLSLLPFLVNSQSQSPNNVKWMEINSEHARVIFPAELNFQAQKVANIINTVYPYQIKTLQSNPKQLPILIFNQTTYTNGYAALSPRKSGWYITPGQTVTDLGYTDWFYKLSSHEYRHVVQHSVYNKGFTRFLNIMFGQNGILLGRYSVPYWFSEGDAILTETAFSDLGRGRIPNFNMDVKTMLLNDMDISYDVAKFRSYKTYYPSHYHLGWLLTSYARIEYGTEIWNNTLSKAMNFSFWPYAFSSSLKKQTGLNEKQLYKEAMSYWDSLWTSDSKDKTYTKFSKINKKENKNWTKYAEPNYVNENEVICIKTGMKEDISTIYSLNKNGVEKKIKATDARIISVSGNKIVWSRTYPDLRWDLRNYSDIILYDLESKKETRLTNNQKLFAPALSNDAKKIVSVEYGTNMKSYLAILDSESGNYLQKIHVLDNDFIRTPSWNSKDNKIVFTASNEEGNSIQILNIENKSITKITEYSAKNYGRPVFYRNFIIYNSPYNGIGNIYAIDINTKQIFQITSGRYGAYNPRILGDKMIYSNYSVSGYDVVEIELNETNWKPISEVKAYTFKTAETLKKQEQNKKVLDPNLISNNIYEVKKYRKWRDVINIHSWGFLSSYPTSYNVDDLKSFLPEVSLNLYSANLMNTIVGSTGIYYDFNERDLKSDISISFKKYVPVFTISGTWEQRSIYDQYRGSDSWEEWKASTGVNLPLNFSSGIWYRRFNMALNYSYTKKIGREFRTYISESGPDQFSSISFITSLYNFRRQAAQDINPKFGQFVYFKGNSAPLDDGVYGNQTSVISSLYFPGFFKHHSINLRGGFEKQRPYDPENNSNYYWFSTPQNIPRGYNLLNVFDKFITGQINYTFPIWYPDINLGPILHVKRLRANIFSDFARSSINNQYIVNDYMSTGLELYLQVHLFRIDEPIEIGGRISYLYLGDNDGKKIIPEFLILGIPF